MVKLGCGLNHSCMMEHLSQFILDRFGLAHSGTLGITSAEITLVGNAEVRIKTHGSGGACRHAHFTADTRAIIQQNPTGLWVAMDGVFWTRSHARRISAVLASDREMEIVGIAAPAQHLNAGPGAPLFPCMLFGAGRFTLLAARALEWVDSEKPVSVHLEHLFSMVALMMKLWREAPGPVPSCQPNDLHITSKQDPKGYRSLK